MGNKNIDESTREIIKILNEFKKKYLKNNENEVINFKDIENFVLKKNEISEKIEEKEKNLIFLIAI